MAEVTNPMGLGQDGFLRWKPESVYGTPVISSMIDLPVKEGTNFDQYQAFIENATGMNDRTRQDPDLGRKMRPFSLIMNAYVTRIGDLLTQFGGAATSAADGAADGSYDHYWLAVVTGERVGKSFTSQFARGDNTCDQCAGNVINEHILTTDTDSNLEFTFNGAGKVATGNVARGSTFSYPSLSPFNFSHVSIVVTKADTDTVLTCMNNFTLTLSYNQDMERYKMCSTASAEPRQPVFNGIPTATLAMNVDADQYFLTEARLGNAFDITLTATHTELAGSASAYSLVYELPKCRLDPTITLPYGNDRQNMDLTFISDYGDTTTNSGSVVVPWEIRLTDAIATHA